ncbi:MAG: methylmalonyl-CoA epimerase [Calditrichae bacterium]|nr:methylmalonyl-CoA epimerase [Calditrichota bacterium]MCB9058494.1 methylmalonyl-CoA epimerase [Calditrichia bacterium]
MLKKIDHIGIAVDDLEAVAATFAALGVEPEFTEEVTDQMVRVLGFHVGESTIEYLQATSSESPIAKYIAKKGNGIHHIAYRVDNLQETLDTLQAKGFQLIDQQPRQGAEGKLIAFVHPKSSNGILIELCEKIA